MFYQDKAQPSAGDLLTPNDAPTALTPEASSAAAERLREHLEHLFTEHRQDQDSPPPD